MFQKRIERVYEKMEQIGLSQLIVSDPDSIWYLTGYDNAPHERMMVLYLNKNKGNKLFLNKLFPVPKVDIEQVWFTDSDDYVKILASHVDEGPIGIDKLWPARFLIPFMEYAPECRCILGSSCVDDVRAAKDDIEKDLMRECSRINDVVMERTAAFIKEGMTELEVAEFMADEYLAEGSDPGNGFALVCFGANASDPHHSPDNTVLKAGDCIVIDAGSRRKRYYSDMTRTFFCKEAEPKYMAIHDLVREANEKAESMIRPGVMLCDVDRAARDHIAAAGYGEYFTHRLGHFIGQQCHEQGDVSSVSKIIAEPGMIFSIEPGVYLPGEFGVRIEDLVLVTEDGCEILNKVDKHIKYVG